VCTDITPWLLPDGGFLGIVYYFVPKRAERPIYSYRLSIVHFGR